MATSEFKFDGENNTIFIDGYESITRTGYGIFSIGNAPHWNSFNDSTSMFSTNNLTIGSLGGLLKAIGGVVSVASSGTDYEPPLTKGNLTESGSSIIIFGGSTTGNVIGSGTTIQVKKASAIQDGYLGKDDFITFSVGGHNPVTLAQSAVTGGLSLNDQEISFRAATGSVDGYLKHDDWNTFNSKESTVAKGNLISNTTSVITIVDGTGAVIGTGTSITINKSSSSVDGYLSKSDWTTFNGKESVLTFQNSLTRSTNTVNLVNDSSTPGNSKYYGTDSGGTKGFFSLPTTATPGGSSYEIQYNNGGSFGATASLSWDTSNYVLQVKREGYCAVNAFSYSNTNDTNSVLAVTKFRGTIASPSAVQNGTCIGRIQYLGAIDSSQASSAWSLDVYATSDWSNSGTRYSYLQFVSRTGTDQYQVARFNYDGKVGIGTHTTLTERLDLQDGSGNGAIRIGNTAGTNAGTIKYASNTFSGYNGSTWVNFGGGTPAGSTGYVQFNTSNAFNADAAFFWDNTNKRLGVNCTDPSNSIEASKDTANASIFVSVFSNSTNQGTFYVQRGRGTRASKAAVQSGDKLGQFGFAGYYDTTNNYGCSFITSYAAENWSSGARGSDLRFELTPATTTSPVEKMRITNDGRVLVGTTTSTGAKVDVLTVGGTYSYQSTMYGTDQNYGCFTAIQKSRGSIGSEATVVDGDPIGGISFRAYGSAFTTSAVIKAVVSGTVSGNNIPTMLNFETNNGTSYSERMRITSTGNLFIGTTAGLNVSGADNTYPLIVHGSDSGTQICGIICQSSGGTARFNSVRHNGTLASKTAVTSGDPLGTFNFYGWDGGTTPTYVNAANIQVIVDGTVSEDLVPARIIFQTRNTGGTFAERMRITSDGKVGIANSSPSALLTIGTAGTTAGLLSLAGATSGTCTVQVAATAGTTTFQLPSNNGTNGYVLQTNGSGITSWVSSSGHNPVTLNQSAITGGLSLNVQEISFRAVNSSLDGYLKHDDWNTFNSKEPALSKGNLTETSSGVLIFGGTTTNNVIGSGTTIQVKKASVSQDGYLGKDDWSTFNSKEPTVTKGNLTSNNTSVITINDGTGAIIGTGTSITINKSSLSDDGYLGKDDWTTFNSKLNNPITANGDLITQIGGSIDNLAIGNESQVLTVVSGLPSWQDSAVGTQILQGNSKAYIKDYGSDGYFAIVSEGTESVRVDADGYMGIGVISPSSLLDVNGNIEVGSVNWFYFGDPTTEGTVRMGKSGNDFVIEQLKSSVWVQGTKVIFP